MSDSKTENANNEVLKPGEKLPDDDEIQAMSKTVRLLSVIGYICLVSGPVTLLSAYYIFLWESPSAE